ncbi:DUF4199 domain-containing protein [Roseivirga misakiensis]|uniref:DUF4199 domain-containing protein n=1 Tax=Roseivirga misakiensis TaxID=1563681 RepID=A0A1E5SJZ6_9BACT|nr:DUF4199 domain-containing protein [Roseivirga misakiensis]OEJ99449.1 hypothetical protein BFP71_07630 [Roseivirga misakiensis]
MEDQLTTGQVAKKWGLIYGLVATVINLIPLLLEVQPPWWQVVNVIVAIVIYALATKEFKTENGGYMSFGKGFKISMIAALIGGAIRNVVNYIYIKFIDPTVMERMQQAVVDSWRDQGMSEEQIEQMSGLSSGLSNPEIALILGYVVVLLGGLIWGAIVSAINKNEAEDF